MGIPIAGVATGVPNATSSINLVGSDVDTGRDFWLKKAWVYKGTVPADSLGLYDASRSSTGAPVSTLLRYRVLSGYGIDSKDVEFPGMGLKFSTGCVVTVDGTATGYSLLGGVGIEEGPIST